MGRIALLAACFIASTAWGEAAPLPAETMHLANGLRVLLAPDPQAHLVSVRVVYQAGSADDPSGLRGVAHLTEHLVATHTQHIASIPEVLRSIGATEFNAVTRPDTTSYFETVAPERLESVLWIESDRMGFASAAVTDERVDAERQSVRNARHATHVRAFLASGYLPRNATLAIAGRFEREAVLIGIPTGTQGVRIAVGLIEEITLPP